MGSGTGGVTKQAGAAPHCGLVKSGPYGELLRVPLHLADPGGRRLGPAFFLTFCGAFGVIFFSAMNLSLLVALLGLPPTGESSFVIVERVVMNDRSGRCSPSLKGV